MTTTIADLQPVPTTWCARCGYDHVTMTRPYEGMCALVYDPRPLTQGVAVSISVGILLDELGVPMRYVDQAAEHADPVEEAAYRLLRCAEDLRRRPSGAAS